MATEKRVRRTQEERTAETRDALFKATVRVVQRMGYGGASTALIAQEAGVSRGAILHHFGTRAELMAQVVRWVFDQEIEEYSRISRAKHVGTKISDWPELLWEVLSKPSGLAVIEILQATRSDPELAARVKPMQAEIEQSSVTTMQVQLGGDQETDRAAIRLLVWAIRGLIIAQTLAPKPSQLKRSVKLLAMILERAAPTGTLNDLLDAG